MGILSHRYGEVQMGKLVRSRIPTANAVEGIVKEGCLPSRNRCTRSLTLCFFVNMSNERQWMGTLTHTYRSGLGRTKHHKKRTKNTAKGKRGHVYST